MSEDTAGPFRGATSTLKMSDVGTKYNPNVGITPKQNPISDSKMQMQMQPDIITTTTSGVEPTIWEGPLSRYNTYPSKKAPVECMAGIKDALKKLENDELVDWELEGYQAFGRMYQPLDLSEYMIQVYQRRDREYQSAIEIRRSGGDSFVHDELNRRVLQLLESKNVLERNDEEEEEVDFGLSLTSALAPLPLDSSLWKECSSSSEEEISEDGDNNTEDAKSISEKNDILSIQQTADELIDVVTDRGSYQDIFRHSSGILCQELKSNNPLLLYVLGKENIIKRLIAPLLDSFYDTLIIRNMLQAVQILLQQKEKHKVVIYENCAKDIMNLKKTWEKSVQHNCIDIRFGRSQQVEKLCKKCLELLE